MNRAAQQRFDRLVDEVIAQLPPGVRELLDRVAVIVLDRPTPAMLRELGIEDPDELCGMHTGVMNTEAGVEDSGTTPSVIHLFRSGIVSQAGGWRGSDADDRVFDEIATTLLHEIGHQFGLSEEDLAELGYD